jgi:omega-hydroxy-beta-dihydromenaquinone-9 sulfotransferase
VHMRSHTDWENFLQVPEAAFVQGRATQVALVGRRIFERVLEDRALIPPENLMEVSYRDLVARPLDVLEGVYGRFGLPAWDRYEAVIRPYLDSLRGYRTNVLRIDDELAALVREHWGPVFDAYGYSTDHRRP